MNYLILILSWGGYLALHSILASATVKKFFEERLRLGTQFFRFLYSAISSVGLLALFFLMAILESMLMFPIIPWVQYVGMVLAVWGVILVVAAFRKISGLAFLGLKKKADDQLVREGIHGTIRHPIYAGIILVFLGMFLYTPTDVVLVSVLVIYAYLPLGIYFEEQKLLVQFGERYREYKRQVPALIPGVF